MQPFARPSLLPLALAASVLLAACGAPRAEAPAAEDLALPVKAVQVERAPVRQPIHAAGIVVAKDERDLAFKVGGIVARVVVREGERVRKGQLLAALDVTEVAAAARQAREALAKADRDRDRARYLRDEGSIARVAAEDAETGAQLAAAAARAADFNLRSAALVAPDDGWVDRRMVEPGEVVAPGRPVLRVSGRAGGFVFRASLADRDVLGLSASDAAIVTLDARAGEPISGRVSEIARAAARGTGTYQVEIRLDAARAQGLLSGLTAKAEIERPARPAPAVPLAALVDGDGESGAVYAIDGDRARRVPVRVAFLKGGLAVLSDLDGIDRVATDGAHRLTDGARVRLVP